MRRVAVYVVAAVCTMAAPVLAASVAVEKTGDASIARDADAGTWTLTAGGATLTLIADAGVDFRVVGLTTASGKPWIAAPAADATVTLDGRAVAVGSQAAAFVFVSAQYA